MIHMNIFIQNLKNSGIDFEIRKDDFGRRVLKLGQAYFSEDTHGRMHHGLVDIKLKNIAYASWVDLHPLEYWMVHRPGTVCRHMHGSEASAKVEAARLSKQTGEKFYIGRFV